MSNTRYLRAKDGTFAGSTPGATPPKAAPGVATAPTVATDAVGAKPVFAAATPAAPKPLKTVADLKRRLQPGVTLIPLNAATTSDIGVPRVVSQSRSGGVALDVVGTDRRSWMDWPKAAWFTGDANGKEFTIDRGHGIVLRYAVVDAGEDVDAALAALPMEELRAQALADAAAMRAQRDAEHQARLDAYAREEAARKAEFDAAGHKCVSCAGPADFKSSDTATKICAGCRQKRYDDYREKQEARREASRTANRKMQSALADAVAERREVRVIYNADAAIKVIDGDTGESMLGTERVGRLAMASGNRPMLIPTGKRTRGYVLHAPGNADGYFDQTVHAVVDAKTGEVLYSSKDA